MTSVLVIVLPVFAIIALGRVLAHWNLAGKDYFSVSDRLVYFVFFPCLLFWRISQARSVQAEVGSLMTSPAIIAVLASIFTVWLLSLIYIRFSGMERFQAGSFSQVTYRFNSYIGMALATSAYGQAGATAFSILISLAIPFINVLAVSTFIWFSSGKLGAAQKARLLLKALVLNPLILSCLAGILWAGFMPPYPGFVDRTLSLLSSITLPLALLSIGGGLTITKIRKRFGLNLVVSFYKLAALPFIGLGFLYAAGVDGLAFKVAVLFLALPSATSAHILAAQLSSDADLSTTSVVLTTLISFITLSLVLYWLG